MPGDIVYPLLLTPSRWHNRLLNVLDAVRATLTSDCYYDEVATSRADGVESIIELWQRWAKTLPDANAKIE